MEYDSSGLAPAADGTKLFFGEAGSGDAIVLLDGIGCDGWAWNHIQPHLAASYRVIHPHYRGHGRSGALVDEDRIDITDLSADLLSVLDAADVDHPAVVVAHSMRETPPAPPVPPPGPPGPPGSPD